MSPTSSRIALRAPPVARSLSPVSGGNWEGTGVIPDVPVTAGEALGTACQRARSGAAGRERPES